MADGPWVGSWRPHRPRGPIAALYTSPGPKYGIPSSVGFHQHDPCRERAPAFSFGLRLEARPQERSPGPGYLLPPGTTARGRAGTPACSIGGRTRDPMPFSTPGPGRYSPERAGRVAFPTAPACSLHSRTRHGAAPQSPGPAAYLLPPVLGTHLVSKASAPSYSVLGRSSIGTFYQDLCKTPGPCQYRMVDTDVYKHRAPRFSMLARNVAPGDTSTKPGPGAYSPQQRRPQGVTFGIRHSEYLAPLIVDVPD
ncbi:ciliary microtubule associated protein 1B isoform X2 [Neopsephotus bourkii]|uniref:ciliary microtubule associated protein 1B isoform X2 n=1 Tax=Neopsephotus bourkii TaxID=309878 RepID=UPI002AA50FED|nr:ciliary microtubule associated protein 1B isoform X2 [Neopsephotus bourkii]